MLTTTPSPVEAESKMTTTSQVEKEEEEVVEIKREIEESKEEKNDNRAGKKETKYKYNCENNKIKALELRKKEIKNKFRVLIRTMSSYWKDQ